MGKCHIQLKIKQGLVNEIHVEVNDWGSSIDYASGVAQETLKNTFNNLKTLKLPLNCLNCGAPLVGGVCSYCQAKTTVEVV